MTNMKAIIVPGNGDDGPEERWRPSVTAELEKFGIKTINVRFPDPVLARKEYWLPFLGALGADAHTILIGHSSGAIATMRYAEKNKILGSVLIGVYYTDMDALNEKKSGYFDKPWDWAAIKKHQEWIVQFASTDDPYTPIAEARHVHEALATDYHEYTDRGHFLDGIIFPELIAVIQQKIKNH